VRILVMEDQPDISAGLRDVLLRDRYEVVVVDSAVAALDELAEAPFDLAVLDVMLPHDDEAGYRVAATMRDAGFEGSILFLTARDATEDRIRGLDLGADDYMVKPFSLGEFSARVRALLRRTSDTRLPVVTRGPLRVDLAARDVRWYDAPVEMTPREFALLEWFAMHPDRVFDADELQERFFPSATSGRRVIRVYVRQLRSKLGPDVIQTISGGYRLGLGK